MSIKDELIAYKAGGNPLKDRFLAFIKDKDVPLDERWETFKEAPNEFLVHDLSVVTFEAEKLLPRKEIVWYDGDFYIERYQVVHMTDFIEDMCADKIDMEEPGWTQELVDAFKEEILQTGLGSFEYDW